MRTHVDPEFFEPKPPDAAPADPDTLDLFAEPEPENLPTPDQERAERDAIIERTERDRSEILAKLRAKAFDVWTREQRAVSANDIRHVLADEKFDGDKRVLGIVFNHRDWKRVGTTLTACEGATVARVGQSRGAIGTYVPAVAFAAWEAKSRGAA